MDLVTDPDDQLPALKVKDSYAEKHRLLRRYVHATHGTRRKYKKACYVELYSGPGRVCKIADRVFADGSPLVAWRESVRSLDPFPRVFVADADSSLVAACATRLRKLAAPVESHVGAATETAKWAAELMAPSHLHLVFLDPFNLAAMPFAVFQPFFKLQRVDFIVHMSANDLQRNLDSYLSQDASIMDSFAPGWRNHVSMRARDHMRGTAFWYWVSLFEGEDFKLAKERVLIRGKTNQPLYWLLNFSRHPLAADIWDDVVDSGDSPELPFS